VKIINAVSRLCGRRIVLSKTEKVIRKAVDKTLASKILRTVHNHEGFYFYEALGEYTGKNAMSLKDLAKMLQVVDVQSVDFHFGREDFRRWIQFILGDVDLASRINRIPQDTRGEKLRNALIKTVNERIIELKKI
jgi:alpha-amylase